MRRAFCLSVRVFVRLSIHQSLALGAAQQFFRPHSNDTSAARSNYESNSAKNGLGFGRWWNVLADKSKVCSGVSRGTVLGFHQLNRRYRGIATFGRLAGLRRCHTAAAAIDEQPPWAQEADSGLLVMAYQPERDQWERPAILKKRSPLGSMTCFSKCRTTGFTGNGPQMYIKWNEGAGLISLARKREEVMRGCGELRHILQYER